MKKFKRLVASALAVVSVASMGALQADAGIGIWGESYGTFCSGDINQDDECTVADMVLMQRYLLGQFSEEDNITGRLGLMGTADLNLDGSIDIFDYIIMRDCVVNPDSQNKISWVVDTFGQAKKEAEETVGNEYVFTSPEQLEEYFDSFAYPDYTKYKETYTADFFEDNVLLMKPVVEHSGDFYGITHIFYYGNTMNIDYSYNYCGKISEEPGNVVLLQVAVPKSRYNAEEILWSRREENWKPALDLLENNRKSNITREEFLELLQSKEEFTWSDFEQYRSEDIGSGMYILKYEIEFENGENMFLYVSGGSMDEKPYSIGIERCLDNGTVETMDIYDLRRELLNFMSKNITREEFLDLLLSKDEFTWSDFEQYRSEDIGSGMYILKYEIEFEDSDSMFLYVSGGSMDEKPESIELERCLDDGTVETIDIYELRRELVYFIDGFKAPENNETNRNNVQKIADYAFSGLKDSTFDLQTVLFYEDIDDNSEIADLWQESRVLYFEFVDEHTVKISLDGGGFQEVYGYLVTDGTVEYGTGWNDNIDEDYDGGGVNIRERNGNLYFFNAGL